MLARITFQHLLAGAWSMFAMIYVIAITFASVPESGKRFADTILGFLLGTLIATILNYFFGSSQGSKTKDATISNMVSPPPTEQVLPSQPTKEQ